MEKRRTGLRLAAAAAGLALAGLAGACEPALKGTRLESSRFVLAFLAAPAVGDFFSVDIAVCSKGPAKVEALKVDAHMPEHKHGMNYAPTLKPLGPGRWRAEGLMFHMPGKWEFLFEVRAAGKSDRLASVFSLSRFFTEQEIAQILQFGPWPPPARRDPGNRVSGKPEAIALGEKLFFEPRLSGTGSVLCATCHVPFRQFQDSRARGFGLEEVDRNTPTVVNTRFYRWYGWDGAHDSLWSQSIRPLLDEREMRTNAAAVSKVVKTIFPEGYEAAFGRKPPADDEEVLADVGKALAAFQETLISGRSAFDEFRDALERKDYFEARRYPGAAQRGLKIFIGKGNCSACHFGPSFTNGEFADTGIPFFVGKGKVDPGRHEGIRKLKDNPFNLLGRFNDDASKANQVATRHVELQHRNFGEWRVPSLRDVALTAPYMHNGSLATLRDVVKHYSELNEERLHADGERVLKRLNLAQAESDDLVAFLESLSSKPDKR